MTNKNTRRPFRIALVALALSLAYVPDALAQAPVGPPQTEYESASSMYTGIALTSTGIVGLGVGSAVFSSMSQPGDLSAIGATVVASTILIPSSILLHIGIPLWAFGASEPDRAEQATALPEVSVGPTGGSLRWSF